MRSNENLPPYPQIPKRRGGPCGLPLCWFRWHRTGGDKPIPYRQTPRPAPVFPPLNKGGQGGSYIWTPDPSLLSGVYLVRATADPSTASRNPHPNPRNRRDRNENHFFKKTSCAEKPPALYCDMNLDDKRHNTQTKPAKGGKFAFCKKRNINE